jgi:predicted DNA-binding ribbon-helix-helix protein
MSNAEFHNLLRETLQEAKTQKVKEPVLIVEGKTHVNILVEKQFYTKLEKIAEKLGTTPDMLINNALLMILKRLEAQRHI